MARNSKFKPLPFPVYSPMQSSHAVANVTADASQFLKSRGLSPVDGSVMTHRDVRRSRPRIKHQQSGGRGKWLDTSQPADYRQARDTAPKQASEPAPTVCRPHGRIKCSTCKKERNA